VTFIPPDITAPRVTDIDIGSSSSTHADYDVPVGSGEQIRTVPVAKINQIFVTFSENVSNFSAATIVSANTGNNYAIADSSFNSVTLTATYNLTSHIAPPDQLILTIPNSVTDAAGNALDSEWTNPTSLGATGTSSFPSGNGVPGAPAEGFRFYLTVMGTAMATSTIPIVVFGLDPLDSILQHGDPPLSETGARYSSSSLSLALATICC
jgi:hypothetical protein